MYRRDASVRGARVVVVPERAQAQPRTGLRLGDIARLLVVWLASSVALAIAARLLPGITAVAPWTYLVATAVAGLLGLAFRPVLVRVVARIGWLAVVLAGLVGQALLVYAAIWIAPGITATFWSAFWASWIVAAAPISQGARKTLRADFAQPVEVVHQTRSPGCAPSQCSACRRWPAM